MTVRYTLGEIMPAHSNHACVHGSAVLPRGGPTGTGGKFDRGTGLGLAGATVQPEIWTIDTTLSSGTWKMVFGSGAGSIVSGSLAYNISTAALKTALELMFGDGKISTVTGTAGTQYVITFADDARYGGAVTFTSTLIALTRTQRGSAGAKQYDAYDGSTITTIDAILKGDTAIDEFGAEAMPYAPPGSGPCSVPVYTEMFVKATDIPNIASGAVGNDKKLGYAEGSDVTAAGTVLRLSQKN